MLLVDWGVGYCFAPMVLATANAAKDVRPGTDFFPLTIDVEERAYAAGKVPGSFFRREGRPTEDAILTCRLTDRPLRPAFPEGFRNETQVVLTVMGADMARNGGQLITTGSVRPIDEQVARWAAVDQVAVKRTIDRVLTSEPITVSVGPR